MSTSNNKKYLAFVDGGCLKNGSHMAEAYGSYIVFDITELQEIPHYTNISTELSSCLEQIRFPIHHKSGRVTNNIAEAMSMFMLISSLYHLGYFKRGIITICSDSLLIINQLQGLYATKDSNLLTIHRQTYQIFRLITENLRTGQSLSDVLTLSKISGDDMKLVLGH